jgi:hypothetical protein
MHRVLLTLSLLLLLVTMLVTSRVGAQAADVLFSLPLPTRPDGARAIETLEAVVVAMGAHLKHEEGREDALEAAWDGTADVQGFLGFKESAPGLVRELTLTCIKVSGGAEALCRDIEQRYRAQYR